MTALENLIINCKNDIQTARNKRDEASIQSLKQEAVIEALTRNLDRLEEALRKSKEPIK